MIAAVSSSTVVGLKWITVVVVSAIAFVQLRRHPIPPAELMRRLPRCVGGLFCFGVGIAVFFAAHLGNPPWDVLHGGLSRRTGLPVGLIINIVGVVVLCLWVPLKERIGLGTALNTVVIGLVVDVVRPAIPEVSAVWIQVLMALGATLVIGFGSGLYIGSGLGAGPRDGLMLGLRRFGLSMRVARSLVEAVTLVVGVLLGGRVGFSTVAFLVLIGPVVQFLLPRMSLPPLAGSTPGASRSVSAGDYVQPPYTRPR